MTPEEIKNGLKALSGIVSENFLIETIDYINHLESQLKTIDLKININNPNCYVMTNPKGDTYSFNPNSEFGEELDDFFYYLKNKIVNN